MKRLYLLTLCSLSLAVGIHFFKKGNPSTIAAGQGLVIPKEWLAANKNSLVPKPDQRPADQTFLTYPEWFLVFSPDEQATYFAHHTATSFPFMSHTAQIWESYAIVNDQIRGNFPPNKGYHFMIWVIGTSASVEYSIKALYETIVGRITDTGVPLTAEDKFNADFTRDYVDFIKDRPWYEFDFKSQFSRLWTTTPFWGSNFLRKIERRYILSSELLVKYGYGKLIGLGTKQVYEVALPTTAIIDDKDSLQYLPRYDQFAKAAMGVVMSGRSFKEIAGNNSAILLTVLVPADAPVSFGQAQTVFIQPIASDLSMKRVALAVPVAGLAELLKLLDKDNLKVEHTFDY